RRNANAVLYILDADAAVYAIFHSMLRTAVRHLALQSHLSFFHANFDVRHVEPAVTEMLANNLTHSVVRSGIAFRVDTTTLSGLAGDAVAILVTRVRILRATGA